MKTPPDRAGIKFVVGAQLEARDKHNKWYSGRIQQLDPENQQVLVQYRRWSKQYQEWFNLFTVRFFDGVIRTVRPTKLKPYDEKWKIENSSEEWDSDSEVEKEGQKEIKEDIREKMQGRTQETKQRSTMKRRTQGRKQRSKVERSTQERMQRSTVKRKMQETKEKTTVERRTQETKGMTTKSKERHKNERKEHGVDDHGGKEVGIKEGLAKKRRAELLTKARAKRKRICDRGSAQGCTPIDRDQPVTGDYTEPGSTHINREVLLERQAHLPTTHKFSREPLYRVIKRQPPPILSIELDHNEFKCPAPNCAKSFRKSSLLRKRLSSEGISDASESKLDFGGSCQNGDEETVTMETGPKPDTNQITRRERNRDRKHFLRVKLKKKKKKKKKRKRSRAVLFSSEDEYLDHPSAPNNLDQPRPGAEEGSDWSTLTAESGEDTPTWPVSAETESEVVRCVCQVNEENDFMIQCSQCQCWQHGTCLGLLEHHIPESYTCFTCRGSEQTPVRSRDRKKLSSDWMTSGHMFGLSCVEENFSEQNSAEIAHTRHLLAHSRSIAMVTAAIGLKLHLLQSGSEAELRLWRLPWRREEGEEPKVVCYVSSEHCYQKPTLNPASPEELKTEPDQEHTPQAIKLTETCRSTELNLLDHIESLQQEICLRLERMETELDGLESWMDELESAEPLSRLPELKQRIRRLLRDLSTVRQLSLCS
ncbi:hypothetical protein WMY93_027863 [Mugilogobius chulae]|uniref:Zinc finger PHD-type domain-containing protein n=1 Tax=Mugilogobius chulae TaxID=88201 RepID=A0AAW0N576_9GOBI